MTLFSGYCVQMAAVPAAALWRETGTWLLGSSVLERVGKAIRIGPARRDAVRSREGNGDNLAGRLGCMRESIRPVR